jgi:hypothetical protein
VDLHAPVSVGLLKEFEEFMRHLKITIMPTPCSVYHIASELNLDFEDRLKFVSMDAEKKESFLSAQLKFQQHLLVQAEKAKDVFHLN